MPWILLGLLIALGSLAVIAVARRSGNQTLASIATWGLFVGVAVAVIGIAFILVGIIVGDGSVE